MILVVKAHSCFIVNFFIFNHFMCVYIYTHTCMYSCVYVCVYICGANRGQKMTSDPLELESQIFVNHHVCAENQIWVLQKNAQCS